MYYSFFCIAVNYITRAHFISFNVYVHMYTYTYRMASPNTWMEIPSEEACLSLVDISNEIQLLAAVEEIRQYNPWAKFVPIKPISPLSNHNLM